MTVSAILSGPPIARPRVCVAADVGRSPTYDTMNMARTVVMSPEGLLTMFLPDYRAQARLLG
jgi:hypothetical protein